MTKFYFADFLISVTLHTNLCNMSKQKIAHYMLIGSIIFGAVATLGYYKIVIIKFLSQYNFEFLLIGFIGLLLVRFLRK